MGRSTACGSLTAAWLVMLATVSMALAAPKGQPLEYVVPTPAATTWEVLVFAAYVPQAARTAEVPYEVQVRSTAGGKTAEQELKGAVGWLGLGSHEITVPAGCERLEVTLRWAPEHRRCDLDLGLQQSGGALKLAPLFTGLFPERVILDADSAAFYTALSKAWPEWHTGFPFWAEIRSARPSRGGVR